MRSRQMGPTRGVDATTVLTVFVCLLLAIPAPMVVGPLGTAGSPATILALGTFAWWAWFHIQRDQPLNWGFQPVREAMLAWLLLMLMVYVHAMASPIPGDEILPADSGMLRLIGTAGIILVANDGILTLQRAQTVVRRLVLAVGAVAVLGVVQFTTRDIWIDRISIPGLTSGAAWGLAQRSGLTRPSGTATHPIEFGMVLTMVLPMTIVLARRSPTRRWLYMGLLGAVAFSVLLAISRSAIICGGVALIVLTASWPLAARLRALGLTFGVFVIAYVTTPGLLGTIGNLFTGISNDASVQSRTGSYEIAGHFISASPLLGRGFGTFLPKYWILDNGYLGLLIDGGVVGTLGLLVLIVAGLYSARRAAARAVDPFDQEMSRALVAAIAAGAAGLAFFDTFAFPQSAGTFFLIIGLAGAFWRLTRADAPGNRDAGARSDVVETERRRGRWLMR